MEEALPSISSCLDFTISLPGSSSGDQEGRREMGTRNLDINEAPEDEGLDDQECIDVITLNSSSNYLYLSMDLEKQVNEEGGGSGLPSRKKHGLSKHQIQLLEDCFRVNNTIDMKQKEALAMKLQLKPRQVEVWFQNRRARSKLKQREMECEYLRKWFSSLTEQNRFLQKEVDELRALKAVPPPSVLLCPRCHLSTASCHSSTDHPLDGAQS